tara:strand:- start:351 stop:509 length:159 start_codon:yes stop_codon:yes gene_type:complete
MHIEMNVLKKEIIHNMSPQLTYHVSIQSAATIVIKPVRMSVMVVTDAQVMVL